MGFNRGVNTMKNFLAIVGFVFILVFSVASQAFGNAGRERAPEEFSGTVSHFDGNETFRLSDKIYGREIEYGTGIYKKDANGVIFVCSECGEDEGGFLVWLDGGRFPCVKWERPKTYIENVLGKKLVGMSMGSRGTLILYWKN
jgi:hypothetical protein